MQFSEKFLYHIWDAQHLVTNLKTVSGKTVKIMFTGRGIPMQVPISKMLL